jgi:TPR repeat protein
MARSTRLFLGRKQVAEAIEEDAGSADFMAYGSEPAPEPASRSAAEYAMPMFLSEDAGQAKRRGFAINWDWNWKDPAFRSRMIKAGIFVAAAAVIAFGIAYLEDSFDLLANVRASLFGTSTDQSTVAETSTPDAVAATLQSTYNPQSPFTQSTVGVRTGYSTARATATRDDISAALRTGRTGQGDMTQPLGPAPTARSLNADEIAPLVRRAKGLIAFGDIASARLLLERAASGQDADAALLLAQTYDPAVLGKPDVRTITPDPAIARSWYQRAAALGSLNAKQRLAQMQN